MKTYNTEVRIKIYVVAEVWRGLLSDARCFTTLQQAEHYAERTRHQAGPDTELGIFENFIKILPAA